MKVNIELSVLHPQSCHSAVDLFKRSNNTTIIKNRGSSKGWPGPCESCGPPVPPMKLVAR